MENRGDKRTRSEAEAEFLVFYLIDSIDEQCRMEMAQNRY